MRSYLFHGIAVLLVVVMFHGDVLANSPSPTVPGGPGLKESLPGAADDIVEVYQLRINSLPYLLARYVDSGDLLVVQGIHETMETIDLSITKMGKSIDSVRHKEIFAKLMAGTQKLKQDVDKNLKAIDHFRRLKRAFDYRSSQLIVWVEEQADEAFTRGADRQPEEKTALLAALREVRITLLKAVSLSSSAVMGSATQAQRDKSRAMWDSAASKADQLVSLTSADKPKTVAAAFALSLQSLRKLERALVAQMGEVKQGWDETLTIVESLEALMQSASAADKKIAGSATTERDAPKVPEAAKK
jgi:hypothetical protein